MPDLQAFFYKGSQASALRLETLPEDKAASGTRWQAVGS